MADGKDELAPHGRDETGKPLTPFGVKVDGTPKLSNRGRKAGASGPAETDSITSAAEMAVWPKA